MADQHVLDGNKNPVQDWTASVVLERDEESGEVTKEIGYKNAVPLTVENKEVLERLGFETRTVTKAELAELQQEAPTGVGTDVAGASPVFGGGEAQQESAETDQD